MEMLEQAKNLLYSITTFNIAGSYLSGGIAASLLAFPLIMLGRMVYVVSIDSFYTLFFIFIFLFLGIIQFVLDSLPIDRRSDIVINRLLGLIIGFYYIPLQLKFIVISVFVFHALRSVFPSIVLAQWKVDLEASPGLYGTIALDVLTGVATNICMQLLRLLLV